MSTMHLRSLPTKTRQQMAAWAGASWNAWMNHGDRRKIARMYFLEQLRDKEPWRFLRNINARPSGKMSARGNQLYYSRSLGNWLSMGSWWVVYRDPSTGRLYVSGVPRDVGRMHNPDLGMAWKYRLTLEEYRHIEQEA